MKRRLKILAASAGAALGLGALVLALLLAQGEPEGIIVGVSALPDSLNPVLEQNLSGMNANELLFDGLTNFEVDPFSGTLSTEFALAEAIDQDPSTRKTYTVRLREVFWHDGTPLTAEDVVYSWKAYVDPANASPQRDYLSSFIQEARVLDARSLIIEFRRPIPEFRAYPVLSFKIIPSTFQGRRMAVNMRSGENERRFAVEPVGTGPFRLADWEIGKWLAFSAHASYFRKRPAAASLVMKKVVDPVVRMNEFRKGRINLILETSPLDRERTRNMRGVEVNWYLPYSFYQVAINARKGALADPRARRALSMALDRSTLVPGLTDRTEGVVLNSGPFPSNLFERTVPEYVKGHLTDPAPRDPAAARQSALDSGLAGSRLILLYPDSLGEFGERMASGLASQLAALGLEVEPRRTGDQVFRRLVYIEKDFDLALLYCDGFDNGYSALGELFRSDGIMNVSGIADAELDGLFREWSVAVELPRWVEASARIHQRVGELAPAIFLCTMEKDVYSRGLSDLSIASDNPFLSAEHWSLTGDGA